MKNNDIRLEKNDKIFHYRVGIVIKNNNKLLIQKDSRVKHLTLPGGRCEFMESSCDTAIREFYEETGLKINFVKSLGLIENFFISSFDDKKYHEILMLEELSFEDRKFYDLEFIENIEEKKKNYISYIWKTIEELKAENFKPRVILDMIEKTSFTHFINRD